VTTYTKIVNRLISQIGDTISANIMGLKVEPRASPIKVGVVGGIFFPGPNDTKH